MIKWKPYIDPCFEEFGFFGMILLNKLALKIVNEKKTHTIYAWLDVKEGRQYAKAIIDECDRIDRLNGIRTQEHTMRWQ